MKSTKNTSGGQKRRQKRRQRKSYTSIVDTVRTLLASVHTRATLGSVYVYEAFFCVSYRLLLTTLLTLLMKNEVNRLVYKMTITHETRYAYHWVNVS